MKYAISTIDRPDIDEALYLLATVSEPQFAQHIASVERQAQEFRAAQEQQRLDFENEEQRRRQEYEQAVQEQTEAYAAIQQQHAEHSRQVRQRRMIFYGAGGAALLIAVVAFVMSRVNMRGGMLDPLWLGIGVAGIALIAAGAFTKEPQPPAAPKKLEPPAPLPPPIPLSPPDPIPLPALPRLAKFYWQLTLAPFEDEQWLVIDPQMAPPRELHLPEQDLSAAANLANEQPMTSEAAVIRALHKMHQLLAPELTTQSLYLATNDSPLAPVVAMLLAQAAVALDGDKLDAPILPGDNAAAPEAMQQGMNKVRTFVERPFGMEQAGVETLFQTIRAWIDRAIASLQADVPATTVQAGAGQAIAGKSILQETAAQACQRLFDELTGDLRVQERDLLHQAQQQADEKKQAIERDIQAKRLRIEDDLATVLRRLDDQIAELQQRRGTVAASQEQFQRELEQATNEMTTLEERVKQAQADVLKAKRELTRLENEHQAAESQLQSKSREIDTFSFQVQGMSPSTEQLKFDVSSLERQIAEQNNILTRVQSDARSIAEKLARDEQQLQSVTGAPGMSSQVVASMRQGVEATRGKLAPAQSAVQAAEAQLSTLRTNLYPLQQEIENRRQMTARLDALQLEKNEFIQNLGQLARHQAEQQQIVDSKTREAAQVESEVAAAQAAGKIKQLEEEVQFHHEQITEIDGSIAAASESKQTHQGEADKKQAELEQARTTNFQQIDEAQASLTAQITQPLQEVFARRDALIGVVTTIESETAENDLYNQQVEQAIMAYRNEAVQHEKEEVAGAIEKLSCLIDQTRSEYSRLLWTLPAATTLTNTPAGITCFLPVWFAAQADTHQWNVVAAGRAFAAMPIGEMQKVHAQPIAETLPWLNYLIESEITSRYQAQFGNHIVTFDKDTLKERFNSLASQQVIDSSLCKYLEQMLAQEISPTTRGEAVTTEQTAA